MSANYRRISDFSWSYLLYVMLTLSVVVVVAIGIGWVMKSSLQLISDSCSTEDTQKESQCLTMRKVDLC